MIRESFIDIKDISHRHKKVRIIRSFIYTQNKSLFSEQELLILGERMLGTRGSSLYFFGGQGAQRLIDGGNKTKLATRMW